MSSEEYWEPSLEMLAGNRMWMIFTGNSVIFIKHARLRCGRSKNERGQSTEKTVKRGGRPLDVLLGVQEIQDSVKGWQEHKIDSWKLLIVEFWTHQRVVALRSVSKLG